MPLKKGHIHFVGIGGIGMSGIAHVLCRMGCKVSGSDLGPSDLTRRLESLGCRVHIGHRSSNLPSEAQVLVYSSSISKDNPELKEAYRRGIPVIHRAEMLSAIFNRKKGIAVTGTHGKTTTTSLISVMLKEAGLNPTVMIGGEVSEFEGNANLGSGPYIVAEADESDGSFTHLEPFYAVITNIETEHMEHFKTLANVKASYRSFIENIKSGGAIFYNHDDHNISEVLKSFKARGLSFGWSEDADIYPVDIKMTGFNTAFTCIYKNKRLGRVELKIPGRHNVLNALSAILVGLNMGIEFKEITDAIKEFGGVRRRFQLRSNAADIMLIDDYAHHPTEIRAVLDASSNWKGRRKIVVFQPHRYTRTKLLADDFRRCFKGTDILILTDIYAASEKPIKGLSVKTIYDKVRSGGLHNVAIIKKEEIADHIMKLRQRGDMILVMGAGDIRKVTDELAERFSSSDPSDPALVREFKRLVKGAVSIKEELSGHTSFKIGGAADIWIEPADARDLKRVLNFANSRGIPIFVIGNGSNLLVQDNGYKGIVVHLGSPFFKKIKRVGSKIRIGAGSSLPNLVKYACDEGLGGLESLVGIPGTVGGAICMNAGGFSSPIYKNIGELVESLKTIDYNGNVRTMKEEKIEFGYRSSNLDRCIILEATLKLEPKDKGALNSSLSQILQIKRAKQVLDIPSAGCIFKNPQNSQFTCGQMIDMLGLKGRRIGGAEISRKHANFIINRNGATSKDVLAMIEFIKRKVQASYNIPLELEIKVI